MIQPRFYKGTIENWEEIDVERGMLQREVKAWRNRFPILYYRPDDGCIDYRLL